jgi:hypothetical protein
VADRVHVLRSLFALDRPLCEILESLRRFPWDSDEDLVILKFEDVATILDRFLEGELSRDDVESWANSIESREDIGFDETGEELIKDAIYQLANPELSGPLTAESARELRDRSGSLRK